jgi:hypothetical protein
MDKEAFIKAHSETLKPEELDFLASQFDLAEKAAVADAKIGELKAERDAFEKSVLELKSKNYDLLQSLPSPSQTATESQVRDTLTLDDIINGR